MSRTDRLLQRLLVATVVVAVAFCTAWLYAEAGIDDGWSFEIDAYTYLVVGGALLVAYLAGSIRIRARTRPRHAWRLTVVLGLGVIASIAAIWVSGVTADSGSSRQDLVSLARWLENGALLYGAALVFAGVTWGRALQREVLPGATVVSPSPRT